VLALAALVRGVLGFGRERVTFWTWPVGRFRFCLGAAGGDTRHVTSGFA
jgi:hypothetical protein